MGTCPGPINDAVRLPETTNLVVYQTERVWWTGLTLKNNPRTPFPF